MSSKAIVSLGSNLGDRTAKLQEAVERLSYACRILKMSNIYETYAKYGIRRTPYLNCCAEIETDMTSRQLMQLLLEIENQLDEMPGYGDETNHCSIDCDLISFEKEVIFTPTLTLPHPDAYRRAFVMIPLAEMQPEWVHPLLQKTAVELAQSAFWPGWGTFFADGKSLLDF